MRYSIPLLIPQYKLLRQSTDTNAVNTRYIDVRKYASITRSLCLHFFCSRCSCNSGFLERCLYNVAPFSKIATSPSQRRAGIQNDVPLQGDAWTGQPPHPLTMECIFNPHLRCLPEQFFCVTFCACCARVAIYFVV